MDSSFLRDPGIPVRKSQMLVFFHLAYQFDVIFNCYSLILKLTSENDLIPEVTLSDRISIFRAAWEIVEHAAGVSQVATYDRSIKDALNVRLKGRMETAVGLWNKKKHFRGLIDNLEKKRRYWPINGLVKWSIVRNKSILDVKIIQVDPSLVGFTIHPEMGCEPHIDSLDNIVLLAFQESLNISRLMQGISEFHHDLRVSVESGRGAYLADGGPPLREGEWYHPPVTITIRKTTEGLG